MTKAREFDFQDRGLDCHAHPRRLFIICLTAASLFVTSGRANDDFLATSTRIDYARLKSDFANPRQESKLRCFWFWQYGVATKESITQDLEAMKAKGYGGALIGDNGGREGQVGPVFMSEAWKANFAHAVKEADRLGLELSLNIQSGWGDPGNPNIQPDNGMKKIYHVTNCWANRLIGDSMLPKGERKTRTNVAGEFEKPGAEKGLRVSGLLGPVRLQFSGIVLLPKG